MKCKLTFIRVKTGVQWRKFLSQVEIDGNSSHVTIIIIVEMGGMIHDTSVILKWLGVLWSSFNSDLFILVLLLPPVKHVVCLVLSPFCWFICSISYLKNNNILYFRNCLFRSLGDQLVGDHATHARHRRETVKYMREHRNDFEPFMEDNVSFDEHCKGDVMRN